MFSVPLHGSRSCFSGNYVEKGPLNWYCWMRRNPMTSCSKSAKYRQSFKRIIYNCFKLYATEGSSWLNLQRKYPADLLHVLYGKALLHIFARLSATLNEEKIKTHAIHRHCKKTSQVQNLTFWVELQNWIIIVIIFYCQKQQKREQIIHSNNSFHQIVGS